MGGSHQSLEVGVSPVLGCHWLIFSHMTTPHCQGDWEMWSRCVSRQMERVWILVNCQESKVIECIELLVHIANFNDPCPLSLSVQQERKCRYLKEEGNRILVFLEQIFSALY